MNTEEKKELSPVQKTKSILERPEVQSKFRELLGEKSTGFITSVLGAMNQNEMLKNADPNSVYMSALIAASLDLPINSNLGFAYIVPYNVKENGSFVVKAQFQVGYKGFKQLAIRTGQFSYIEDSDVREGEIISRNRLTGEITFAWIENEKERSSTKIIGYVSSFGLNTGFQSTFYMTTEEITAHATRYSQSFKKGYGVWKDNFDVMAKKTVCKLNLSKNAPLSIDVIHKAIQADQSVIKEHETIDFDYVDNEVEEGELINPTLTNGEVTSAILDGITLESLKSTYSLTDEQVKMFQSV